MISVLFAKFLSNVLTELRHSNRFLSVMSAKSLCLSASLAILLTACSSSPQIAHQTIDAPSSLESGAQIEAIQFSVREQNYQQADILLFNIVQLSLSAEEQLEVQLLEIESAIQQGQAERSLTIFQAINYEVLNQSNDANQARFSLLKASQYELTGLYLSAARERDFVSTILDSAQAEQNHEMIWQDLTSLPEGQLEQAAAKYSNNLQFSQWLQLAAIAKHPEYTLDEHVIAINQWQQKNLAHPANNPLPANLKALEDAAENQPQHVALLLPLSGKLARTSQAIRDGFMAAFYKDKNKGAKVPQISLINTAQMSIERALIEAEMAGADTVIGPLSKKHIGQLMMMDSTPMPVLALNYAPRPKPQLITPAVEQPVTSSADQDIAAPQLDENGQVIIKTEPVEFTPIPLDEDNYTSVPEKTDNLFQFGLAAEDEARMVALKAYQDGHRRALVFLPENAWGQRISTAFINTWQELGGEIAEQRFYPKKVKDYNPDIKAVLNVDDSQQRFKTIRRMVRGKVEYEPRRRQDADFIFLVALPKQARQIKPTLAFNFAGKMPVYATSHVFSGKINRQKDRDLNGIIYAETPWLLLKPELKKSIEKQQPQAKGGYSRLYALGVDAFRLYPRLQLLNAFPQSQIPGVTGDLVMSNQGRVQRRMLFAQFRSGKPGLLKLKDDK